MSVSYLSLSDHVYEDIENRIRATYKDACIMWIEKIENPVLEKNYLKYQQTIHPPHIKTLFHGTSEKIARIIIKEGFDPAYNRTSVHGLGCYFATTAVYSKNYCKKEHGRDYVFMLVVDVVTGKSTKGRANTPIPGGYNSATNSTKKPTMYIVNKKEAALPKYLVAFYPNV